MHWSVFCFNTGLNTTEVKWKITRWEEKRKIVLLDSYYICLVLIESHISATKPSSFQNLSKWHWHAVQSFLGNRRHKWTGRIPTDNYNGMAAGTQSFPEIHPFRSLTHSHSLSLSHTHTQTQAARITETIVFQGTPIWLNPVSQNLVDRTQTKEGKTLQSLFSLHLPLVISLLYNLISL